MENCGNQHQMLDPLYFDPDDQMASRHLDQDYDQHLLDMENQIQRNQIRLRNELEQIKNV